MKKNISIGIIALLISIAGCKKPVTVENYTAPLVPNSIDNLTAISANTYANLRSQNLYGWSLLVGPFAVGEHIADEAGYMDLIDNVGTMAYNHPLPGDEYVINTWNGYFSGISSANSTLSAASLFAQKYAVASDSQNIRYIRGESLFMRAWYYFQVESFFGQKYINMQQSPALDSNILGVPLFTAPPTSLQDAIHPRATARQVWTQIINDLRTASTLLPSSWSGDQQQRASSWAAEALLGKAFVFTQQWDSAKKYLGDVITNSGKSLMPFNTYKTAFNDYVPSRNSGLTDYGAQPRFNQESLFELYVQRVPGNGGYGIFGTPPNQYLGTSMGLYWAPSGFNDNGVSISMSGRANIYLHDRNLLRFGFTIPADSISGNSLVPNQSYPDSAVAEGTKMPSNWYIAQSQAFRANKTDDPRLYVCALEPYMDTVYFSADLTPGDRKKRLVAKYNAIPRAGDGGGGFPTYLAWSFRKYQTLDADLLEPDIAETDGADYYLLRLADVYLLEAEALMNAPGGAPFGALDYINSVHRRAYGYDPTLGGSSPIDYHSLTDATKADPSDVNLANNPLAYERFVELFAEGHWWFDIGRWGNSTNSVSGPQAPGNASGLYRVNFGNNEGAYYGNLLPNDVPSRWSPASTSPDIPATYCYPIPITELNANASIRAQARGGQNYPF